MKGKGKSISNSSAEKECPLLFPDISSVSHSVECPQYSSVLTRNEEEGIAFEELDGLQSELENLLAACAKRLKLLKTEIGLLSNTMEKKDKKPGKLMPDNLTASSGNSQSITPGSTTLKRTKTPDERPNKKFKESTGKDFPTFSGDKLSKLKYDVDSSGAESSPAMVKKMPVSDTVAKFWAFVEPYCAEVKSEDIKFLEEVFRSHDEDAEYFKIPSLGKHYSLRWSQEDLISDAKEGAKISEKMKGDNKGSQNVDADYIDNLLKKAESSNVSYSPFGPLTQRLVSALIEENIMTNFDNSMSEMESENVEEISALSPRTLARQLNIGNPSQLERRLRRELEEHGIMEAEDAVEDDRDDEILQELKKKQQELKAVTQQNHLITKRLLKLAKCEIARQDLRNKLIAANSEIVDAYRRIQNSRQKKKTVTKKEKDAVWRALKDREVIVKQLEAV